MHIDWISIVSSLVAIVVHGAGHLVAARLCGLSAARLRKTPTGFRLLFTEAFPSYDTELYCALGGPVANAGTALFCRLFFVYFGLFPSFCAMFIPLSLYWCLLNLLPLPGFDGERILRCLLCVPHRLVPSLSPQGADRVLQALGCLVWVAFWLLSIYLLLRKGSALCLFVFCFQLLRSAAQKESIRAYSGAFGSIGKHTGEYWG